MKQFFLVMFMFLIFIIGKEVEAHSYLKSSFPEHGSVIEENVQQLILNFDGGIEQNSKVDIVGSNHGEVEINQIVVESPILYVTLSAPLTTDDYEVKWVVIGDDGHPTSGNYHFSVFQPFVEEEKEEDVVEEEIVEEEIIERDVTESEETIEDVSPQPERSLNVLLIVAGLSLILAIGFLLYRKQGKK